MESGAFIEKIVLKKPSTVKLSHKQGQKMGFKSSPRESFLRRAHQIIENISLVKNVLLNGGKRNVIDESLALGTGKLFKISRLSLQNRLYIK